MRKVAILGGGIAGLTTAFELTNAPNWKDNYDITIYQLGWRVGGKGASGRNSRVSGRIQEHGLHIWMGFYENAFHMMRYVYDECRQENLMPHSPLQTVRDAFLPLNYTPVMEKVEEEWRVWNVSWPANNAFPGEDSLFVNREGPPTPWGFVLMLLDRMVGELEETTGKHPILSALYKTFSGELMDEIGKIPDLPPNAVPEKHTWLHRIAAFAHTMTADPQQHAAEEQQHLVIRLRGFVDDVLKVWDLIKENDLLRHLVIMLDLAASTVIGMIDDRVITDGFMAIEHYDGNEWLEKHGCHFPNCPITQGMYDAAFAYEGGESKNRRMGAGSLLYGALRLMLTYRGAFMWHMAAGMGETIMSPLYLALRQRGVHLAFFHKVTNLGLSADKKRIETIDIDIQATVKPEYQNGYEPLFPGHDGIPCWPTKPFYDQLVQGNEISKASNPDLESWWNDVPLAGKKTLQWKTDFDLVVLAISRGAFEYICKEPIDAEPKWKLMTDNIKTVKTQGLQLWLHRTSPELGWQGAPPVLSGYTEPFDTWSDMSYLLPRESWAPELKVKQLAYFCNCLTEGGATPPFSDSDFPKRERDRVEESGTESRTLPETLWRKI